jgi:hypothetical protein
MSQAQNAVAVVSLVLAGAACNGGGSNGTGGAGGQAGSSSTSATTSSTSSSTTGSSGGTGSGGSGGGVYSGGVTLADCATPPAAGAAQLVAEGANGAKIAVTPQFIYWVDQGKSGEDGTPTSLYQLPVSCTGPVKWWGLSLTGVSGLVAGVDHVYFAIWNRIMALPLGGATDPVPLAMGTWMPGGLAIDDTYAYWSGSNEGTILRVPLAGGTPEVLVSGEDQPQDVALGPTNIYWLTTAGDVRTIPKSGGAPVQVLATAQPNPAALTAGPGGVYWGARPDINQNSLMFAPFGGAPQTLWFGTGWVVGVAAAAPYVYWTSVGPGDLVRGSLAAPGPPEVVATGYDALDGVALGQSDVYWVESGQRRLWRKAK